MVMLTTPTKWYLDFREVYGTTPFPGGDSITKDFSYGPFQYSDNETISVQDLLDDINDAFEDRHFQEDGPLYEITAQIIGGYDAAGDPLDNFAVKYQIQCLERKGPDPSGPVLLNVDPFGGGPIAPLPPPLLNRFKVRFKTGPHGFNTPVYQNEGAIPRGEITIKSDMDTRAVVLPYSTHINTILDNPPVPPDFRIVPFSGVSNRLLLLLNSSTGEFDATPVIIKETDLEAVANQYVAQTNESVSLAEVQGAINNGKLTITYKNDDPIDRYEIFRTTTKPNSYADFAAATVPYRVISGRITMDKRASGAHLIDDVQSNTKYYYCVRAIDVHNNFSNPTHVFEAELVDNEGQVYLILKTIYFEETIERIETKAGRRYIYIEPSLRNVTYNTSISPDQASNQAPSSNILGPDGDADCWDKTLKIRVTSKNTGKKVDLNVTFKNSGVVTP